jgi:YbbR domain-containing protein
MLVVALLLGLATWAYVIQDLSPTRQDRVDDITLRVLDLPPQTALITEPPQQVAAVVKATNEMLATLGPSSFDASVSLAGLSPGLHRVPIAVEASVRPVQIVTVEPSELDIQLAPIVTRTVEVRVVTVGDASLSPALEIGETPTALPTQVLVSGAEPQVQSVAAVVAEIDVPDTPGTVRRVQQVRPVDGDGNPVRNVEIRPDQVEIGLTVAQRGNARTVGVRVDTSGDLPDGYRLSRLVSTPSQVTLLGDPQRLTEIGGVISTTPIALSQAVADFTVQVPLELPEDIDAIDPDGNSIRSVRVQVGIEERIANIALMREVEVIASGGTQFALDPTTVEVVVNGPVPLLNEIKNQPELLRVVIEASALSNLQPGETATITPRVVAPDGVRTELVPETVGVTAE